MEIIVMQSRRRLWLTSIALAMLLAGTALAHHGWRWTEDGNFELIGVIESARLGNPHGVLTMDVDGETWTAEVGQPWRNERAGLADEMLSEGAEVTISGQRSADPAEKRIKAERVIIDGVTYDLYPERD
jgi:hypothetical protein